MKIVAISVLLVLVIFGLSRLFHGRSQTRAAPKTGSRDAYQGLRDLAFQNSRARLGLPPPSVATQPWGAIMDWGLTEGTATVVAISDGSASVYLSSGGGFIGGGAHKAIHDAAQKMVAIAAECQSLTQVTTTYPLPERSEVRFYLLTDAGIFTASAREEELSSHRHPLAKLGDSGQDIITQYRLLR
jgi:hypothetical protein